MSDARSINADSPAPVESPAWIRVLRTPLGELLHGRITSEPRLKKLTAKDMLAQVRLPARLSTLIQKVADRSRLWKSERLDVTRELIAHFSDALEGGASADALAESFGDPNNTARLIRRAKKRQRPLWWRTLRLGMVAFLAIVGLYLLLALRFFVGRPNIAHNYIADLQAMVNANPESDRAWPLYRQALIAMGRHPEIKDDANHWDLRSARPGQPHWELAEAYVTKNADSIALVRDAAHRKALGYTVGLAISAEDLALWPEASTEVTSSDPLMENAVIGVLLPYLAEMRRLAAVLAVDARRAASEGDGQTVVANLTAIINMTRQLRDLPILIQDLVGNAILAMAAETAGDLVANSPKAFGDAQLQELAHRFAAVRDSDINIRLNGERMFFNDILQRLYTDDGNGDGRMTSGGMRVMAMFTDFARDGKPFEMSDVTRVAAAPAMGAIALGRADIHREYNSLMDQFEAEAARPLWEQDTSAGDNQIGQWMASPIERYRRLPLVLLAPAIGRASQTAEITKMTRDVTLTAIALELYRRRHDHWPNALDELVPSIMPKIPPDRFDGQALKYTVTDAGPILYCVGSDGDDDGGQVPINAAGVRDPNAARTWFAPARRQEVLNAMRNNPRGQHAQQSTPWVDGDWLLWPRQTVDDAR